MRAATTLLAGIAVAVLATSPAAADVSPFVGHWEGIDGDDSRMIVNISHGPNGTVSVFFKDFGASACGLDPDTGGPLYAGQFKFSGVIDGDLLSVEGRGGPGVGNGGLWCMANPPFELVPGPSEPTPFLTYDEATDSMTNGYNFFFRVRNN